jgi:hypothetical protein
MACRARCVEADLASDDADQDVGAAAGGVSDGCRVHARRGNGDAIVRCGGAYRIVRSNGGEVTVRIRVAVDEAVAWQQAGTGQIIWQVPGGRQFDAWCRAVLAERAQAAEGVDQPVPAGS